MRTTFVITNGPTLKGGLEHVCLRLAQHLGKGGGENRIACRYTQDRHTLGEYFLDHEPSSIIRHEGVSLYVISPDYVRRHFLRPVYRLSWRPITHFLAVRLYRLAVERSLMKICEGSDLIHYLGSAREMLGFAALGVAKKLGVPFVIEPAVHPGQWGDSWSDKKLYRRADKVLAHSEHERKVLIEMGVEPDRAVTVVHGVDIGNSGMAERFRKKHELDGPIVLFLGRKTKEKGVGLCLDAFEKVRERFPTATLVLAGPSGGKMNFKPRLGVLDLDDLSESDKEDALAGCDLLCVPSAGESFGMVYFEAWAYAKPVIALDLPTLRETVGENKGGLLTPPDGSEVASAILKLLEDPALAKELGEKGREAATRHGWERAAESYQDLLAPLLPAEPATSKAL